MDSRYQTTARHELDRIMQATIYKQVLAAVARAQDAYGFIPDDEGDTCYQIECVDVFTLIEAWDQEEAAVKHETAAFIRAIRSMLHPAYAPYVYLGMTSSDLIDCTSAVQWNRIRDDHLRPDLSSLIGALTVWAQRPEQRMGRTHGRLAEPVAIGAAHARAARALTTVKGELTALHPIPGKISGPVGAGNQVLTQKVVRSAAQALKIGLDPGATQIVDRHYYRRVAADLIEIVSVCEQFATLHRLSAIEGVDLFAEDFDEGVQMGSSIMPFKRNPVQSERICGLARVARGHYAALLETWSTSWWERDLSNSSVERVAWWDLVQLTHYLVLETKSVVQNGHWRPDVPEDYRSRTDELISRQVAGEDPDSVYREIQSR